MSFYKRNEIQNSCTAATAYLLASYKSWHDLTTEKRKSNELVYWFNAEEVEFHVPLTVNR